MSTSTSQNDTSNKSVPNVSITASSSTTQKDHAGASAKTPQASSEPQVTFYFPSKTTLTLDLSKAESIPYHRLELQDEDNFQKHYQQHARPKSHKIPTRHIQVQFSDHVVTFIFDKLLEKTDSNSADTSQGKTPNQKRPYHLKSPLPDIPPNLLIEMLLLSHKCQLNTLKAHCVHKIEEMASIQNASYLMEFAVETEAVSLQEKCTQLMEKSAQLASSAAVGKEATSETSRKSSLASKRRRKPKTKVTIKDRPSWATGTPAAGALTPSPKSVSSAVSDVLERMPFGSQLRLKSAGTPTTVDTPASALLTPYTRISQKHWMDAHQVEQDGNMTTVVKGNATRGKSTAQNGRKKKSSQKNKNNSQNSSAHGATDLVQHEDALELESEDLEANLEQQHDELISLEAMYGMDEVRSTAQDESMKKFEQVEDNMCVLNIQVDQDHVLSFEFLLPKEYPSHLPPTITTKANWIDNRILREITRIQEELESTFTPGEVILFEWFEKLLAPSAFATVVRHLGKGSTLSPKNSADDSSSSSKKRSKKDNYMQALRDAGFDPVFKSSSPTVEKGSKFIAHACGDIHSVDQVKEFVNILKTNNKYEKATHNMVAYRFEDNGALHENRDDDGENSAGDVLLKLLQQMDMKNVMVVVSRWFGGTMLGSKRFKLISSCARDVLQELEDNKSV